MNFGAGPDPYFSASVNPALLPDKNTLAHLTKQQHQGEAKVVHPDLYVPNVRYGFRLETRDSKK